MSIDLCYAGEHLGWLRGRPLVYHVQTHIQTISYSPIRGSRLFLELVNHDNRVIPFTIEQLFPCKLLRRKRRLERALAVMRIVILIAWLAWCIGLLSSSL